MTEVIANPIDIENPTNSIDNEKKEENEKKSRKKFEINPIKK